MFSQLCIFFYKTIICDSDNSDDFLQTVLVHQAGIKRLNKRDLYKKKCVRQICGGVVCSSEPPSQKWLEANLPASPYAVFELL